MSQKAEKSEGGRARPVRSFFLGRVRARPLVLLALALTPALAGRAHGQARLVGFQQRAQGEGLVFTIQFSEAVGHLAYDEFDGAGYFYIDFGSVAGPTEQADWPEQSAGLRHVRRVYYPAKRVLRFIFYSADRPPPRVTLSGSKRLFIVSVSPLRLRPLRIAQGQGERGSKKLVIIDPGHGGRSVGARTSRKIGGRHYDEKELTLAIAARMAPLFALHPNLEALFTRNADADLSLEDRIAMAERSGGDLFLSIHLNATSSRRKEARGFEVYYLSDGSKATNRHLEDLENDRGIEIDGSLSGGGSLRTILADLANSKLRERRTESFELSRLIDLAFRLDGPFGRTDRGVKSAAFAVLMNYEMPAVLAECGFLDNPADASLLVQPAIQNRIAALLFNAVNLYFSRTDPAFEGYSAPVR